MPHGSSQYCFVTWLLLLLLGVPGVRVAQGQSPSRSRREAAKADRPEAVPPVTLPSLRRQAAIRRQWLKERLERVLPRLMRELGVPMWLVINREYNEDPVFFSLTSPNQFAARRRTIYVFYDRGPRQGLERLALGGGSSGGLYRVYRDPDPHSQPEELMGDAQWKTLRRIVEERQPASIAVDTSRLHAFSDGLSASEEQALRQALGREWSSRLVPAGRLPLLYLETRVEGMLPWYRRMMRIVEWLISRAFSGAVITPGMTSSEDVVWWLRQQVNDLGLGTWFHPTVRVQRRGHDFEGILGRKGRVVIERGDVLHVDFGIRAMGLDTDTQHMGYVLREGESDAPAGIRKALARCNRLQDIVLKELRVGRTGNQVLRASLQEMKREGIEGRVYTHPIGDQGHGAGPLVGLWDHQEGVPGRGDLAVIPNSWFSIELSLETPVPEWDGQKLWVAQEEDAAIDARGRVAWVLERQTRYHLVR